MFGSLVKSSLIGLVMMGNFFAVIAPEPSSSAGSNTSTQSAVCDAIGSDPSCTGNGGGNLTNIIKLVINIISVVAGALAVIMIIYAGMKYISSGGDSSKLASAKTTLIYAIIGLFIVAVAQFIVRFVLTQANEVAAGSLYNVASLL